MSKKIEKSEKVAMLPVGEWIKLSFGYVFQNWKMLLKVYGWGMLMYLGSFVVVAILVGVLILVMKMSNLITWQFFTGSLIFLLGVAGFLFVISVAGRMVYFFLLASKAPTMHIRETWRSLTWKQGLAIYWILLLMMFAGYAGMLLFIVPGIIIFNWISFSFFVRVEQGVGGVKALMLSRDYVRGYAWQVLGRWLLVIIMTILFLSLFVLGYTKLMEVNQVFGGIGFVLYMISVILIMMVTYRLGYTMYLDLIRIKGKLPLTTSPWRTFRWNLLAYSPFVLAVITIIISFVITLVNPNKQIQKARENALHQQQLYDEN